MDIKLEERLSIDPKTLRVKSREGLRQEFKQSFDKGQMAKYCKTIAAMTNADGGMIYFGVAEKPNRLVGVDPNEFPDVADFSNSMQKWFDPHVELKLYELPYRDGIVMALSISESRNKPCICKNNSTMRVEKKVKGGVQVVDESILSAGAIYRRYSGKSELIKFSEVQEIFTQRDQKVFSSLMENMSNIKRVGFGRAGVADISSLGSDDEVSRIYLPSDAVKKLNLIDKGNFVETEAEGEKSYFVAGKVQLHDAVEIPVDDRDRWKPGKVVETLKAEASECFFSTFNLVPSHLCVYAKHYGFRGEKKEFNDKYAKWDIEAGQWFYREAFVRHLRKNMTEKPRETLEIISSKGNLEKFDRHHN